MVRTFMLISLLLLLLFPYGSAVQAAGLSEAGLTNVSAPIESPSAVSRTHLQNARPTRIRFEGTVSAITATEDGARWLVAGVEVHITASTLIAPQGYQVAVGDWVQVKGVRAGEGPIVAEQINAQVGAIEATLVEFRGVIEDAEAQQDGTTKLIISGRTVIRSGSTVVEGELLVGYLAEVRGEAQADGVVFARRILSSPPATVQQTVEFEGTIEQMQLDWWLVGGVKVWIAGAEIPRQGIVGWDAEVKGRQRSDGSVDASLILVEELSSSQTERLTGQVVQVGQDSWIVSVGGTNRTIYTGLNTFIDESRAPAIAGNLAEATVVLRPDETWLAIRIKLSRPG